VKERISKLKDRMVECIQSEEQKEKRMKKSEDSLRDSLVTIKQNIFVLHRRRRERRGQKAYSKK